MAFTNPDYLQPSDDAQYNSLVQEARALLEEVGYRTLTPELLAERLSLPLTAVTKYFPDALTLGIAVLKHRDVGDIVAVRDLVGPDGGDRPWRALRELVRVNASQPRMLELYCVINAESIDPAHPAHQYFRQRYAESRDILADIVRDASSDPQAAAVEILALMDGLQVQWLHNPDSFDLVEAWDTLSQRIL